MHEYNLTSNYDMITSTRLAFYYKYLENWTSYIKQLFLNMRQKAVHVCDSWNKGNQKG